jgi:hypothetical protein
MAFAADGGAGCRMQLRKRVRTRYRKMSFIPRVTETVRELIAREFDDRGPNACITDIIQHLERHNPELLDMAAKCAGDLPNERKAMLGFGMFYRLLILASARAGALMPLPRVSAETRTLLVAEIDNKGSEDFTKEGITELEKSNPELLQMAHNFASGIGDYLHAMQGFALLYKSLLIQEKVDRAILH